MLVDHHYFSKIKQGVIGVASGLLLSACSSLNGDIAGLGMANVQPSSVSNVQAIEPASKRASAMTKLVSQVIDNKRVVKPETRSLVAYRPVSKPVTSSPWCDYLKEDAAAETTILKAPTVSAQINDSGRKSATVAYDLVNVARAHLIEEGARVKCQRYKAKSALNRVVVVAPNKLTRAGFKQKARSIARNHSRMRSIKAQVRRQLSIGNLDRNQSTVLLLAIDQIIVDGAKASSEAAKRQGLVAFDLQNAAQMAQQLVKAEKDLAEINSNIRSADAVSVNLEGGWRDGLTQNGLIVQKDSLFGGVKVSVKLGAFNPSRKRHEEAALAAKLRAYRLEPGSIFWKISQLISAHKRARLGLVASRSQLVNARRNVGRLRSRLPASDPAYLAKRFRMEIEGIKLDAEINAVSASIGQLDRNLRKLTLLTPNS